MKKLRKWCMALLAGCMILVSGFLPAFAEVTEASENYTYTVKLYAGKRGSISGTGGIAVDNRRTGSSYQVSIDTAEDAIIISGLMYGDVVSMDAQSCVNVGEDAKYYIEGVRKSGRDNDTVSRSAFTVEEDADYVTAYAIKGNMVAYTVNYVDGEGNALLESRTYYGSVGDRAVVAFQYIDNYMPLTYNLSRTLKADASKNVFTFVYEDLGDLNNVNIVEAEEIVDLDENDGDGDEVIAEDDGVNLEDDDVPLAYKIMEQIKEFVEENMLLSIGTMAVLLIGVVLLLIFLLLRKKKKKEDDNEESSEESKEE